MFVEKKKQEKRFVVKTTYSIGESYEVRFGKQMEAARLFSDIVAASTMNALVKKVVLVKELTDNVYECLFVFARESV